MAASLAEDVFESIHSVMHRYRAQQYRELRDGPSDLTHMEHKVLGFFARHPEATQSDLVEHSGRDKGLLDGQADPADRRSIRLRLTAAGEAVHKSLAAPGQRLSTVAVAGLSEEECRQLLALLGRIDSNLQADTP